MIFLRLQIQGYFGKEARVDEEDTARKDAFNEESKSRPQKRVPKSPVGANGCHCQDVCPPPNFRRFWVPRKSCVTDPKYLEFAARSVQTDIPPNVLAATGDSPEDPKPFSWLGGHAWHLLACSRKMESTASSPQFDLVARHPELTAQMRTILVSWLAEVEAEGSLPSASGRTLPLAVQILDRYLATANRPVNRKQLQLVGITAFMIATKYESANDDDVVRSSFNAAYMCDDAYTVKEVNAMELDILKTLNFKIGHPVPADFLEFYQAASILPADKQLRGRFTAACLLCSVAALLQHRMTQRFPSSMIAASCVLLVQQELNIGEWNSTQEAISGYGKDDLKTCASALTHCVSMLGVCSPFLANKFSSPRFFCVLPTMARNQP